MPRTLHSNAQSESWNHILHLKSQRPVTPISHSRLQYHLEKIGYDSNKTKYLVDGFREGFRLEHVGEVSSVEPVNDPSVLTYQDQVQLKIDKELQAGRMLGPFDHPPFPQCHISPIKIVKKSEPGKFRLIQNLSWPYDDSSINSQIPDESKSVKYTSVRKAIKLIMSFPKGSFTRKTDIQHAFKLIPIHPSDHHKLVIKFNGKYYIDLTLPMGAGSACQIFDSFSTALQAIYEYHVQHDGGAEHYLDDFFFVDITEKVSLSNAIIFDDLCQDIGIPQNPDKKTSPSHSTVFLSITLDSLNWIASLHPDKLVAYTHSIQEILPMSKITQHQLQSIVGKLSFASSVVPARAFLRRLIAKIQSGRCRFPIKVTNNMRLDLQTWITFLSQYNGVTFFRSIECLPDNHLNMGADASRMGYGATYGKYWIQEHYPHSWQKVFDDKEIGITVLELYPILALIGTFGSKLKNHSILFHSDNEGVVEIINKQTSSSKKPVIMNIVRPLVLLLMQHNILLRSCHIPGIRNKLCDAISRFQVTPSLLRHHNMNNVPSVIPDQYKSGFFRLS